MRLTALVFTSLLLIVSQAAAVPPEAKLSGTVKAALSGPLQDPVKVWVYFSDHGERNKQHLDEMLENVELTDRSRERRLTRSYGPLVDVHDLPVNTEYLQALRDAGCRIRHASKYLNAASGFATPAQIREIAAMPFVRRIDRVQTARREIPPEITHQPERPHRAPQSGTATFDYGDSFDQLDIVNVIPLHEANVNGEGVIVAIFDTGFNRSHEALIHLDIIAEWDFINHDPVTKNEPGDPGSQHNHGTATLSALGGFKEGQLIGPA